MTIELHI